MKLNARITVKFLLQIGALFLVVWCIIGVAFGFYLASKRNSEQKASMTPVTILEKMPVATSVHGNSVHVDQPVLSEIKQSGGWLQILDNNGREIYSFDRPKKVPTKYAPGLLVYDRLYPAQFGYQLSVWYGTVDKQSLTWLYGLPPEASVQRQPFSPYVYFLLLFMGSLLTTIGAAILFGRRIGAPILHMMNWLQNLANQSYLEPTGAQGLPKSKKDVNGPLRRPYRMYREVLATLEHLAVALQQSEEQRKRLDQTRDEWIAGISHDLHTPLSSIQGYANLLAAPDYVLTANEVHEFGEYISDKATYMSGLIEELGLTFRLKNESLSLQSKPEDIIELTRRSVITLVNDEQSKAQTVLFESVEDELIYPIDARWFTRALDNLLANAVLHNPVGVTISVEVQSEPEVGCRYPGVRIQVKDDGVGMDEDTVAHLFDRYYRGTNTSEIHAKGTGLGTAIAKQLIEAHGGHITVESVKDQGTSITIQLPPRN
ncbi:ATP-binding protein [Alicyclobacillus fodiniaquatilis]|uniref:histidine kinase n=1 Tax=Alicyclobacillus fodiniaquatilis TaxID=1661150 RepID=A0ABW4JPR6_9BACL